MTILVAGALSDAGRAIARTLLAAGDVDRLLLLDDDVAGVTAFAADLGDPRVAAMEKPADAAGQPLDMVVHCQPPEEAGRFQNLDLQGWDETFDARARCPWQLMKAVASALEQAKGRWVSVLPYSATGVSAPALSAIRFLTQALDSELTDAFANVVRGDDPAAIAATVAMLAAQRPPLGGELMVGKRSASRLAAAREPEKAQAPKYPSRVIITGGAGLIGKVIAKALDRGSPLQMLLVDRDGDQLAEAARELASAWLEVETFVADLADPASPLRIVECAVDRFGGIDAVFSHAGVGRPDPVMTSSDADFDLSFAVNLRASWLLAKAALPWLRESGGTLIATGTIGALRPGMSAPIYSASKAALLTLVEQLALELGPLGVRVNAVSPGSTLTPMNRLWGVDTAQRDQMVAAYPLGRMADPAEIAAGAAFLASPAASYISGHNLVIDGALSRAGA